MLTELTKLPVQCNGGLDLVSPRYTVPPGTLQDCLNYETYSTTGYAVMEGLQRYDGTYPPFERDWVVAVGVTVTGTFTVGEYLKVGTNYFGVCTYWDGTNKILHYLIQSVQYAPKVGDTITGGSSAATLVAGIGGIKRASLYYPDELTFLAQQKLIYEAGRVLKNSIYPFASYAQNVIPHGLQWYKGRLYAIADSYQVSFTTGTYQPLPNDQLLAAGVKAATVLSVSVTSGSWGNGDAAGTMTLRTESAASNSVATGSTTVRRAAGASGHTDTAAAINITATLVAGSPTASLFQGAYDEDYQTQAQVVAGTRRAAKIWAPVDMGWQIQFATDATCTGAAPATVFRGNFLSTVLTNVTATGVTVPTNQTLGAGCTTAFPLRNNSSTVPSPVALSTLLGDLSTSSYVQLYNGAFFGSYTSNSASVNGFNLIIPDASTITGIEFTIVASGAALTSLSSDCTLTGTAIAASTVTPSVKSVQSIVAANVTTVLGGPSDLWGLSLLSAPQLLAAVRDDPKFGIQFNITSNNTSGSGSAATSISGITLKVYYQQAVTAYYAHDPVTGQDLQIQMPYYRLLTGQFNPGAFPALYGTGSFSVYNVTPLDAGGGSPASTTSTIGTGWQLWTARNGTGNKIANFTSQMTAAQLPPRAQMESVNKRFEIINANYYANSDWLAFYGVSGVGPSFQYDGYYFYNVYTALPITEDTPSHIAFHRGYAALGYENGQVITSLPNQPTNFDPTLGSTIYPFGNRVTGLLSLNGTALGVFCESAIHALTGDILVAIASNNAVNQTIAPYSGAIEYTVVDCGTPLFADFRGISTINATNKYGDFENGRVSFQITPFLQERVNDRFSYQASNQNILFAKAVRNKNQYRLYFADGKILTCSLPIGQRSYEFTTQQYTDSTNLDTMVPVCMAVGTTASGRDLLFGTFKLLPDDLTNTAPPNTPSREVYIYAMDKGTRFDLAPIRHYVLLNFLTVEQPNAYGLLRKFRLEMLSQHYFNGYTSLSSDYAPRSPVRLPIIIDPTGQTVRIEKGADYLVASVEGVGTTIAIEIGGEHIYPGHVLQGMLLYSLPGREQLGNSPTQSVT